MNNLSNNGAAVRNSFINEFAFGDKSAAIKSLIKKAHSTNRFDFSTDCEYYRNDISAGKQRLVIAVCICA